MTRLLVPDSRTRTQSQHGEDAGRVYAIWFIWLGDMNVEQLPKNYVSINERRIDGTASQLDTIEQRTLRNVRIDLDVIVIAN